MIFMYLIMMKMFIAILDTHYIELTKDESESSHKGLFDVIFDTIKIEY
jgi:hypothetical protein